MFVYLFDFLCVLSIWLIRICCIFFQFYFVVGIGLFNSFFVCAHPLSISVAFFCCCLSLPVWKCSNYLLLKIPRENAPMTLTSTGAFLIPASLPGTMVVDFIQAHKEEAYSALKDIDGYAFRHITHSLLLGLIHMLTNSTCN